MKLYIANCENAATDHIYVLHVMNESIFRACEHFGFLSKVRLPSRSSHELLYYKIYKCAFALLQHTQSQNKSMSNKCVVLLFCYTRTHRTQRERTTYIIITQDNQIGQWSLVVVPRQQPAASISNTGTAHRSVPPSLPHVPRTDEILLLLTLYILYFSVCVCVLAASRLYFALLLPRRHA